MIPIYSFRSFILLGAGTGQLSSYHISLVGFGCDAISSFRMLVLPAFDYRLSVSISLLCVFFVCFLTVAFARALSPRRCSNDESLRSLLQRITTILQGAGGCVLGVYVLSLFFFFSSLGGTTRFCISFLVPSLFVVGRIQNSLTPLKGARCLLSAVLTAFACRTKSLLVVLKGVAL